jgi:hypothetical protein
VITATIVGRRFTEKELKASRAEKARAQIAMPQHKSSSTKVTKPGAPQKGSNFQETLRRAEEVEALLAAEKATKEVEKVARRQREDEEREEQKKKLQRNSASTSRPTAKTSGEKRKRIQQQLREKDSDDEESAVQLEKKKAEAAERKKAERRAERKAEEKKSGEKAEAEKKKVEEQTKVDKKSAKKVTSTSDPGALAASSEVESQTPEKAKPVAPEESTSSKSAVEAQPTAASTEAPSGLQESTPDALSTFEDNDGAVEDAEQSASDQSDAEDDVDDTSAIETPKVLVPEHREIERDFPKLSASQQADFLELLRYHHKKFDLDEDNLFELSDLLPETAVLLAVRLRSLLDANEEQGQPEADQASDEHSATDKASATPSATEQPEQTQLSAPEGTINKNGKSKKKTAMDAGMPRSTSSAPAKKSKLSDDASALITQAGQVTEDSQAETSVTKPQELVPKPETVSDSIKASPVPAAHDAPKEEDSSATESHTANEKSSDAKSSEDTKKSPATEQTIGKAKPTTNTSATSAETQ